MQDNLANDQVVADDNINGNTMRASSMSEITPYAQYFAYPVDSVLPQLQEGHLPTFLDSDMTQESSVTKEAPEAIDPNTPTINSTFSDQMASAQDYNDIIEFSNQQADLSTGNDIEDLLMIDPAVAPLEAQNKWAQPRDRIQPMLVNKDYLAVKQEPGIPNPPVDTPLLSLTSELGLSGNQQEPSKIVDILTRNREMIKQKLLDRKSVV